MAIIMNDKTTFHTIRAIPMNQLATVREWLTDIGQTCTHGSTSMIWPKLLESIRSIDEELFWADVDEDGTKKDVGWEFLNAEARVDSGDEPSEEESAFEIDSEDESEEDDDDDDFSLDEESSDNLDDEAYSDEDISEEEGDWEREARNADKKRRFDLEDDNRGSSRKRSRRR